MEVMYIKKKFFKKRPTKANKPVQELKPKKVSNDLVDDLIPFKEVLVISQFGDQLGTMTTKEAIKLAEQDELNLLCVSPNSNPPVCKILNYGKFKFEQKKKEQQNKKNQKANVIKEVKFIPQISDHDMQTKINFAIKYLQKGAKIKLTEEVRGRLHTKTDFVNDQLNKFLDAVKEFGKIEKEPIMEGNKYYCIISPISKK